MQTTQTKRTSTADLHQSGRKPRLPALLLGSTTAWLLFWLVFVDVGASWLKPLRYVDLPAVVVEDQDPLDTKVRVLESSASNYNVLMLGSSLTSALATAEQIQEHGDGAVPPWRLHTQALTLDTLLRRQLGVPATALNMGIDACMIMEDKLLLQKSLDAGQHPKLLLLFVAPRDFISNTNQPYNHVYKYFSDKLPLWCQFRPGDDAQKNLEKLVQQSSILRNRAHYRQIAELTACMLLHRAPNLFYAQKGADYWATFKGLTLRLGSDASKRQPPDKEEAVKKLMLYYEHDYLPINYKRFGNEMASLAETLQIAARHHVLPIVVNMPRGQANQDLLPSDFQSRYLAELTGACKRAGVRFFNYQGNAGFSNSDFSDGVHLAPAGAKKFLRLLTQDMAADGSLHQRLTGVSW